MRDAAASPDAADLDAVFHALSDPRRRDMVTRLSHQPLSVSDLAEPLGMRLPSAIKHLAILEASGLVTTEKTGRVRTCRINAAALTNLNAWIARRETALNAAFDRLDEAIADFPWDPDT